VLLLLINTRSFTIYRVIQLEYIPAHIKLLITAWNLVQKIIDVKPQIVVIRYSGGV
jgi:hypothetical protein